MALSKIQSESLNLADNFNFTGTVTGAGGLVHIATTEATSGSAITFNSSLIDVTVYERYLFYGTFLPVSDGTNLHFRFLDNSDAVISTSSAYREMHSSSATLTARDYIAIFDNTGSAENGEFGSIFTSFCHLKHVGNADLQACITSTSFRATSANNGVTTTSGGHLRFGVVSGQPAGFTFFPATGDFARCKIQVFGVSSS